MSITAGGGTPFGRVAIRNAIQKLATCAAPPDLRYACGDAGCWLGARKSALRFCFTGPARSFIEAAANREGQCRLDSKGNSHENFRAKRGTAAHNQGACEA